MQNSLTAQEEIFELIKDRVAELAIAGKHEQASALMIEYERSQLADSHPSKNPVSTGILQGEQVSAMSQFDTQAEAIRDKAAFISALSLGGVNMETMMANAAILMHYLSDNHPSFLPATTKYLLEEKANRGIKAEEEKPDLRLDEGGSAEIMN